MVVAAASCSRAAFPQREPEISIKFQIPVKFGMKASGRKLKMKMNFPFQYNNKTLIQIDERLASSEENKGFGMVQLEPGPESKSKSCVHVHTI